jgi:hypothetical protein
MITSNFLARLFYKESLVIKPSKHKGSKKHKMSLDKKHNRRLAARESRRGNRVSA